MNRALRLVWVLLLSLALPLQGLAAATMAACGPAHPHDVAQPVHAHDASAHAAHGHRTAAHDTHVAQDAHFGHDAHVAHDTLARELGPQAPHGHVDASPGDDAAADEPAAEDASSPTPSQKCSVCASCCTASAGLPTHAVVAEPAASADSVVDLERATAAMFLTGGPERPPRSFLA